MAKKRVGKRRGGWRRVPDREIERRRRAKESSVHTIEVEAVGHEGKRYSAEFDAVFPKGARVVSVREAGTSAEALRIEYARLEETSRMLVERIVDSALSKAFAFAHDIRESAVRARIESAERLHGRRT